MNSPSSSAKSFLPDCRTTLQQKLIAIVTIVFFNFFFKFELLSTLNTHFIGGALGDAGIYVWLAKLFPASVSPLFWFETNGFFPYSLSLAFSDNWILPSFLTSILTSLGAEFTTSYNLVYLLALAATGFLSFILLYSLTGNFLISLLGGVVAPHLAPFQHHLGHPQLQHYWILPLTLYLFFKWLNSKKSRCLFFLAIGLGLSFLTSVYLGLFATYLLVASVALIILLRPLHFTAKELLGSAFSFLIGIAFVFPFMLPYRHLQDAFGTRFYYEPWMFQASPVSYLSFGPFSWLSPLFSFSHSEAHLGIGALLLTLSIVGFAMAVWSNAFKKLRWYFLSFFIAFGICSLIPTIPSFFSFFFGWSLIASFIVLSTRYRKIISRTKIAIFTNQEILFFLLGLTMFFIILSFGPINSPDKATYNPYYIFYRIFPGLDGIRAVARFGLLVDYLCFVTAFFVLALLQARKQITNLVVVALAFLILFENYTARFPLEKIPPTPSAFNAIPSTSSVGITLPYGGKLKEDGSIESYFHFAKRNVLSLIWSWERSPSLKLVNGFSGVKTKIVSELPIALFDFPSENSLRMLSAFTGLDTIIILPEFFEGGNSRFTSVLEFQNELKEFSPFITIENIGKDQSLLLKLTTKINLAVPFTLLISSKAKTIQCQLKSAMASNMSLCDPSYFTIVQVPGSAEAPFRCSGDAKESILTIFLPPAIKTIPSNSVRISGAPSLPKDVYLTACKQTE